MLGDLLTEINGQKTSITVEPPVPEGPKVQVEVASEISGRVSGTSLETHTSSSVQMPKPGMEVSLS
jgi:hypothetical protein